MKVENNKTKYHQRKSTNPATSAWVEASAGTGKTKVLTDRILRILITGTPAANILCLTFTKSAATEMEDRLRERLLSWSTMPDNCLSTDLKKLTGETASPEQHSQARQLYDRILHMDERPNFHTIHSFCESLLRKFPAEAGIDGSFTVLDDQDASAFLHSARDHVLQQITTGSNKTLKNALHCVSKYTHSEGFFDLLSFLNSRKSRLERLTLGDNLQGITNALRKKLDLHNEASQASILDTACENSSLDMRGLHWSIKELGNGTKTDKKKAQIILEWLSAPQHQRRKEFGKYCAAFITQNHQPAKRLVSNAVQSECPDIQTILETEQNRLLETTTTLQRIEIVECTTALLQLTNQVLRQLEHDKMFHNCLDYDDLIIRARQALHSHGTASWMLYKLDNNIDHILLDEAQDTSTEQWEIIKALASEFFSGSSSRSENRTIFAVGDYKQSIYSFQQAEPDAFQEMHRYFRKQATAVSAPWSNINLQLSFRSAMPILQAIDLVFPPDSSVYNGTDSKLSGPTNHHCYRSQAPGLVELWPVIKPKRKRTRSEWKLPTRVSGRQSSRTQLANHVAIKIASLLSGKGCPEGTRLQPGDILVLVRRRTAFVTDLIAELKKRRIPVAGIDRLILTDSIAVMDLVSLGHFLLNTDDDLSLAEVLKSPLCNFDDNDLFDTAYDRDSSLWTSLCQSIVTKTRFQKAKRLLGTLLEQAKVLTPYELFADLLFAQSAAKLFISRIGLEAIEPLEEFLNNAIQYETDHAPSLQGFIDWIENRRSIVRRDTTRPNEKAVRILTVHGAKGLEAPVVFLPDTVQQSHQSLNILWPTSEIYPLWIPNSIFIDELTKCLSLTRKKKAHEEYQRLFYVAMTRAKDQLYICGWSETPNISNDCWHSLASLALAGKAKETIEILPTPAQQNEPVKVLRIANFPQTGIRQTESPPSPSDPQPLPPWATQRLENDNLDFLLKSHRTINFSSLSHLNETRPGKLIAQLVDFITDIEAADREAAADHFITGLSFEVSLALRQTIKKSALKIRAAPNLTFLFEAGSRGCLPVSGRIQTGRKPSLVYSSIDRLVVRNGVVTVINFQAGERDFSGFSTIPQNHLEEIAINAILVRTLYPTTHITSAILWTEKRELESISNEVLGEWPS